MKAIGITCGIGSLLIGARQAGFDIVGNVEWRRYYHHKDAEGRNTFTENFPGAFFVKKIEDLTPEQLEAATGCDLAMGHPECGHASNLNQNKSVLTTSADIPLFVELVSRLKPRFFVMDDLPKAFIGCPMKDYVEKLPDYDLFPEWISNYHYGNIQKGRKRFFMIGALKSEKFVFVPGEFNHLKSVREILFEVDRLPNHDPIALDEISAYASYNYLGERLTWGDLAPLVKKLKEGENIPYINLKGMKNRRLDSNRCYHEKHSHVLIGSHTHFHSERCTPFTIRERARIQGFPDDFIFYGTLLNDKGEWNPAKNLHMAKQTGKAMPIQFARFISEQIRAHIEGRPFNASEKRLLKSNPFIDEAKRYFCSKVGYSDQERACIYCHQTAACEGPQTEIKYEK